MSPRAPASPGHFDRFNFCNAAPEWDLEIEEIKLDGNMIFGPPFLLGPMMVDHLNGCMADRDSTQVSIRAKAVRQEPFEELQYDATYGVPSGSYLNNIVFGIMQRCVGFASEAVFFGEAEITDTTLNTTTRVTLPD